MLPAFISLTRALTRLGLNILSYQNVASHFEKWVKVTVTLLFVTPRGSDFTFRLRACKKLAGFDILYDTLK